MILNDVVLIPFGSWIKDGYNNICNFKEGKFVIKSKDWECIVYSTYYYAHYNCLLAYFDLYNSSEENHDFICYDSITHKEIHYSFNMNDMRHYAVLNLDGTIRDNKIFIGCKFENIEKVVDLNEYSSLDDYKVKIVPKLEEHMRNKEKDFYQSIQNYGNVLKKNNCLEQELIKTLNKK